ncbi:ataxin-10-like [Centruroides sculpturatus]|uniref:ataxin-10-like n=1 Tax=Centruroides sculpturatus TaxID=218467 RepID=UPI000C6EFC65|nr:ataxin-10-like [Centruroides sculpturatus]
MAEDNMLYAIHQFNNLSISDVDNDEIIFQDLNAISTLLKNVIEALKIIDNREKLENWSFYGKLISAANNCIQKNSSLICSLINEHLYANLFRFLRNASAGVANNQQIIFRSYIFQDAISIFGKLLEFHFSGKFDYAKVNMALLCGLQFVGNLVCQYNEAKVAVWEIFYIKYKYFNKLLLIEDIKIKECTAMVFYNCLSTEYKLSVINNGIDILINIAHLLTITECEWSLLVLDSFLQEPDFMVKCYNLFPVKSRLLVLDIIAEKLYTNEKENDLSDKIIFFIGDNFKYKAMDIVKICSSQDNELNSLEIARMLLLLCKATAVPKFDKIKADRILLETAIDILKTVHLLGKSENNVFSPVSSLRVEALTEDSESHSTCGFKRNLIRLIANMCSENQINQNFSRTFCAAESSYHSSYQMLD